MEKFKRTFSLRKKKDHVPESSKPHQWQEDEQKVRDGTCSFQVRYLGCIEVFESRGIHVCEEAVKALKAKKSRSVWSRMSLRKKKGKEGSQQCKGKYQRAILYVSGDALRVVDEISKGLIVDQTIEKVSFCAPDRNHEKGFAYICRDGTTRRWMCHGFLAVKESGERLSHAVGCAFSICLEKKQKREKDSVQVTYNEKGTSFTRLGSFRQASLTERMMDPQSTIIPDPVPPPPQVKQEPTGGVSNVPLPPTAIERPRASADVLQRQMSFRGFNKLAETSPFKRQLSLRLNELPSTIERTSQLNNNNTTQQSNGPGKVSPIPEASPSKEQTDISDMCKQLSAGLTALSSEPQAMLHTQTNTTASSSVSDAEFWLQSTATAVSSTQLPASQPDPFSGASTTASMNGQQFMNGPPHYPVASGSIAAPTQYPVASGAPSQYQSNTIGFPGSHGGFPVMAQVHGSPHMLVHQQSLPQQNTPPPIRPPGIHQQQQLRSHSIDIAPNGGIGTPPTATPPPPPRSQHSASPWGEGTALPEPAKNDPFDTAWNQRTPNRPGTHTNPFQKQQGTPAFTVNM